MLHYIALFVISHQEKALGHFSPMFQQCPDLSCQKMQLHHPTVTPQVMNNNNTEDVCLCYSCSSVSLFVLFFLYTSLDINLTYSRSKIQTKHLKITILNLEAIKIYCPPETIGDSFAKADYLFIKMQSTKLHQDLRARQ